MIRATKSTRQIKRLFVVLFCLLLSILVLTWLAGFRVNLTSSLPLGLYRLTDEAPQRRSSAFFCLDSREFIELAQERNYVGPGYCPGGIKALGKTIYGLPGDLVNIETNGAISINSQVIPGSAALPRDSRGRVMPAPQLQAGIIPPDKALMLSLHHKGSFDGRYFGLTSLAGLQPIQPVLVFN